MEKKYYKSIEDFSSDNQSLSGNKNLAALEPKRKEETGSSITTGRRDFLKLFGYSIASAAVLHSCEQPVQKAIPYLIKPDPVTPGKASFYASTYYDGCDYGSILVKVRDGRPIKIEGNNLSSVSQGSASARIQATVLGLYDNARYRHPMYLQKESEWEQVDGAIIEKLQAIKEKNGTIALISPTIISPSSLAAIEEFKKTYPTVKHIQYDAVSANAIREANNKVFNKGVIPSYHFNKANVIVSFGADFLGNWLMSSEYAKQYSSTRKLDKGNTEMSYHVHFEAGMSLTGSNADQRIILKNSVQKTVLANLYNAIAKKKGEELINANESPIEIDSLADTLLDESGKSLVVSGSNDIEVQVIVNSINYLLGNYGSTIDLKADLHLKQGIDKEMDSLTKELNQGKISGLILYGVNPAYNLYNNQEFVSGIEKTELSVSISNLKNESAEKCMYLCPDHHPLEAWNDYEIKTGLFSLSQPAIRPIFETRAAQESLLKWSGIETEYLEFLKAHWEKNIYPTSKEEQSFYDFWNKCVHDGVYSNAVEDDAPISFSRAAIHNSFNFNRNTDLELELYESVAVGAGNQANNPWLQELPDPVTKVTWDNYACISTKLADEMDLKEGDLIKINSKAELPVLIQPGQEHQTISVALGYGRTDAGAVAEGVGANVFPFASFNNETRQYFQSGVKIEKVSGEHSFAKTQSHHSMEGRALIRETTLDKYIEDPSSGNELHKKVEEHHTTLYEHREFKGHHWGMAIDLNTCNGCNACVVACNAENNIPVVGKEQVNLGREMHWMRIDRYYSGEVDNPEVVRQPVMCQHCDNAPCENVCPVGATTNSSEGVNQMAYNRCIGTRYCNNNCPYKVRRFNFYDYNKADAIPKNTYDPAGMTVDLQRMVLNPDVVVRAKGVIEKCSFCIQRIQEKKLNAKLENRPLADGEIKPACAQTCPADAIVFGDLNNKDSKISKFFKNKRNYHLLEELHTLPTVGYLTKVRNKKV